jgi:hypothetical protein
VILRICCFLVEINSTASVIMVVSIGPEDSVGYIQRKLCCGNFDNLSPIMQSRSYHLTGFKGVEAGGSGQVFCNEYRYNYVSGVVQ